MRALERLERWFQGEIVRPWERADRARTARAAKSSDAAAQVHVLPSPKLSPAGRIGIYSEAYFYRLLEVLAEDYRAVKVLAGPERFERLVRDYLIAHPSRHYSLGPLGAEFPSWLRKQARVPRSKMLADVARLELTIARLIDAPEVRPIGTGDVARIAPEAWNRARLVLVPALELLAFDHGANAIVTAARQEKPLPPLTRKRSWTVAYRKDWTVWRMDVSEPMYAVLRALRSGKTLDASIRSGARLARGSTSDLQAEIAQSFGTWISEGFFAAISVDGPRRKAARSR